MSALQIVPNAFPEPAIPAGYKASTWQSWTEVNTAAYMLGLTKQISVAENFDILGRLEAMIGTGMVQRWKQGKHHSAPTFYRMFYK